MGGPFFNLVGRKKFTKKNNISGALFLVYDGGGPSMEPKSARFFIARIL
jgi:hypothetical protein